MLQGSLVALITPMNQDGSIHYEQLRDLIDWHIESGTDGIVAVGTTGESATLSVEEHLSVIEETVKHVNKRVPVIAGTGANNTLEAIALSRAAEKAGADYTLSVVPYYNKPSQEGIYQHFKTIAESTSIPMIIYNVPGRTVVSMTNDTILRLAKIPNIVGVKEASGNIGRVVSLINNVPEGFAVYSGDDPTGMASRTILSQHMSMFSDPDTLTEALEGTAVEDPSVFLSRVLTEAYSMHLLRLLEDSVPDSDTKDVITNTISVLEKTAEMDDRSSQSDEW